MTSVTLQLLNLSRHLPEADFVEKPRPACSGMGDLFFPDDETIIRVKERRTKTAKALCAVCPILAQCRDGALKRAEPYGIWGGTDPAERRAIRRQQAKARSAAVMALTKPEAPTRSDANTVYAVAA